MKPAETRSPKILAIKNRSIGDTILTIGTLRQIKIHFPNHKLYVICPFPACELLEGLPFIDRIISLREPKSFFKKIPYWFGLIRKLRDEKFKYVFNFHSSLRTAFTLTFLRREVLVVNSHDLVSKNWFSDLPVPDRGQVKPIIDRDLDLLRATGISANMRDAMPEICLSQYEKERAYTTLKKTVEKSDLPKKAFPIFLGLGAGRATKQWPIEYVIYLMEKTVKQFPEIFFVTAITPQDSVWKIDLEKKLHLKPNLKDRFYIFENLSLRQTASMISCCKLFIGNDSSLKHIAIALGLKTITFFGPEAPLEWHPYDSKSHPYFYIDNLMCRTESGKHWCSIQKCTVHDHICMKNISPEPVFEKMKTMLQDNHQKAQLNVT